MITPRSNPCGVQKGLSVLILNEQTVDETKSTVVVPGPGIKNHTFTLKASAALTGNVQIETATEPDYTGVWSPLGGGPIDLSTIFSAAGEYEFQFSDITFGAARVRITTVVAGGTLSAHYLGN